MDSSAGSGVHEVDDFRLEEPFTTTTSGPLRDQHVNTEQKPSELKVPGSGASIRSEWMFCGIHFFAGCYEAMLAISESSFFPP